MYIPGRDPFSVVKGSVIQTEMFFVTAMVNADQARDLLMHNKEPEAKKTGTNRKASSPLVKEYSLLMLSGQWYLNPAPIVFAETGHGLEVSDLNDGQHRLKAVVLASQEHPDIEIPFVFAFDAPSASKWILDLGKRRMPKDWLQMYGEVNANQLSHAVRALYALEKMQPFQSIGLWRKVKLTPQAQQEFLDEHEGLRYALQQARDTKSLVTSYVGAVLYYLMHREYGVFKTGEFFTGLATGANLAADDPRLKTREFLAIKQREGYKWDGLEQLAVLIATVNAWLMGQDKFVAKDAFKKLSKTYPQLLTAAELPVTVLTPGNR